MQLQTLATAWLRANSLILMSFLLTAFLINVLVWKSKIKLQAVLLFLLLLLVCYSLGLRLLLALKLIIIMIEVGGMVRIKLGVWGG